MRIGYWTGWLDPEMVAVSKEVHQLMRYFPKSFAFGLSSRYVFRPQLIRRCLGVHPKLYPVFRYAMPFLERSFDITHVYTSLADWHFLSRLGARPMVLTVTQNGKPQFPELLRRVGFLAAESEPLAVAAVDAGVPESRVGVVYPGVDLDVFRPAPPPKLPWKCIFASSPENSEEVHSKGVDLLVELARREPTVEVTLLWRPFGREADAALALVLANAPSNLRVIEGRVSNIHELYARSHFTVAPFRTVGKPCPNSILEGLAVGRPALVSEYVDIGEFLERQHAGVRFSTCIDGLHAAFEKLCADYAKYQAHARVCAESQFDLATTVARYRSIYEALASNGQSEWE